MRILFVHDDAWVCQSLSGALNSRRHVAHVIANDTSFAHWSFGAKHVLRTDTYRLTPTFMTILTNGRADIINTNNYSSWVAGEFFKRILHVPHIILLHGSDVRDLIEGRVPAIKRTFLISLLKAANLILATTPDLLKYSQVIKRKILHLPQPIVTNMFNEHAKKNELPGDPTVFSPTRLDEIKGARSIIQILEKIAANFPSSHIFQVKWGRPSYLSLLSDTVPSKNLTFVDFIPRDLLPSWYVSSDIVIGQMALGIMSNIELEAMSCKTPVIVYDRYYNYCYGRRDLESAWEMTYDALSNHGVRQELVRRGARIIEENHDINLVAELYLKYLDQALHID